MPQFPTTANEIIRYTIEEEEGGFIYTDHPDDPDEGTYAGVTFATWKAYCEKHNMGTTRTINAEVFKGLAEKNDSMLNDEIIAIYQEEYFNDLQIMELPDYIRQMIYSIAVNLGTARAGKILQTVINEELPANILPGSLLKIDGNIGPATISAARAYLTFNMELIRLRIKHRIFKHWMRYYIEISTNNAAAWRTCAVQLKSGGLDPDLPPVLRVVSLQGWFNRAMKYIEIERG